MSYDLTPEKRDELRVRSEVAEPFVGHGFVAPPFTTIDAALPALRYMIWVEVEAALVQARAEALQPIRDALAGHPHCDHHPDDDPISCGWKRAVADIQAALAEETRP